MLIPSQRQLFFCIVLHLLSLSACEDDEFKAFGFCLKSKYFGDYTRDHIQQCSRNIDRLECIKALYQISSLIKENDIKKDSFWYKFPFSLMTSPERNFYTKIKKRIETKISIIDEAYKPYFNHDHRNVAYHELITFIDYYKQAGTLPICEELNLKMSKELLEELEQCRIFAQNKEGCKLWKKRINLFLWNHRDTRFKEDYDNRECDISILPLWRMVESDIEKSLIRIKKLKNLQEDN